MTVVINVSVAQTVILLIGVVHLLYFIQFLFLAYLLCIICIGLGLIIVPIGMIVLQFTFVNETIEEVELKPGCNFIYNILLGFSMFFSSLLELHFQDLSLHYLHVHSLYLLWFTGLIRSFLHGSFFRTNKPWLIDKYYVL